MKRTELARSAKPMRRAAPKKRRGTTTAAKKRKAIELWGKYVHQRDVFCQRCGRGDGKLDAHHVMIRNFAITAADEDNGVLLCFKCHGLMHSDPFMALVFYTDRYGLDDYEQLRVKAYGGQGKTLRAAHWEEAIERLTGLLAAAAAVLGTGANLGDSGMGEPGGVSDGPQ